MSQLYLVTAESKIPINLFILGYYYFESLIMHTFSHINSYLKSIAIIGFETVSRHYSYWFRGNINLALVTIACTLYLGLLLCDYLIKLYCKYDSIFSRMSEMETQIYVMQLYVHKFEKDVAMKMRIISDTYDENRKITKFKINGFGKRLRKIEKVVRQRILDKKKKQKN